MDLIELSSALGPFFDREKPSPSHDELDVMITRCGLREGDPRRSRGDIIGKMKRVRQVLVYATDHDAAAGLRFARSAVAQLRAVGAFHTAENAALIPPLQRAFASLGWTLAPDGNLRESVLEGLSGVELTEALRAYQRRANIAPDDPALQVGNAKDLVEATARHVLQERRGGAYPSGANFPTTLAGAYIALNLEVAPKEWAASSSQDPEKAVEQALFQLACAVNRLRNKTGTGHGRPQAVSLSPESGRLVARANALVTELLLNSLDE